MRFRVAGRDRASGKPIQAILEAEDVDAASVAARGMKLAIESINPEPAGQSLPPLEPLLRVASAPPSPARRRTRLWALIVVLGVLVGALIAPVIGFIFCGFLALMLVLFVVPGASSASRSVLGLPLGRPVATAFKVASISLLSILLFLISLGSREMHADLAREEVARAQAQAQHAQAVANANATVDKLTTEARASLEAGDVADAEKNLVKCPKCQRRQIRISRGG